MGGIESMKMPGRDGGDLAIRLLFAGDNGIYLALARNGSLTAKCPRAPVG